MQIRMWRGVSLTTFAFAAVLLVQCTAMAPDGSSITSPLRDSESSPPVANQDLMASVYPQSLGILLNESALIVIGEIGPVYRYHDYIVYSNDGRLLIEGNEYERAYAEDTGIPATDMYLTVHQVFRDDGTIARGEPIYLRVYGHVTDELFDEAPGEIPDDTVLNKIPIPEPGKYLFLLGPVPEGGAYTQAFGQWGKLVIDGETLRLASTGEVLEIGDSGPVTLAELLKDAEVEDARYIPHQYSPDPSATPPWLVEDPPSDHADFTVTEYLSSGASDEERAWREKWVAAGGEQVLREQYELNVLLTQTEPNFLVMWSETSFKENIPLKVTIRVQNTTSDEFTEKHLKGISWADLITVVEVTE